ncbi:MAG: ATP-binding protein [Phycisphaerales bacterium]
MDGAKPPPRAAQRRKTLHDVREQVEGAMGEFLDALRGLGYDEGSVFAIRLALEEAINNGFRHGNKSDPGKVVRLAWSATSDRVQIEVEDEGEGFDPQAVPDPTAEENLEIPSGRGLMLMRAYMNEVEYLEPGNRVRLVYVKQEDAGDRTDGA